MSAAPETDTTLWTYQGEAVELTNTALSHYAVHRRIVLRKLELARDVSSIVRKKTAIRQAQNWMAKLRAHLKSHHAYGQQQGDPWGGLIQLFCQKVIYEDDLMQIEILLSKMPAHAHVVFTQLQRRDKPLRDLSRSLDTAAYQEAKQKIIAVQKHKNPLTGLTADEYEQDLIRHLKHLMFEGE